MKDLTDLTCERFLEQTLEATYWVSGFRFLTSLSSSSSSSSSWEIAKKNRDDLLSGLLDAFYWILSLHRDARWGFELHKVGPLLPTLRISHLNIDTTCQTNLNSTEELTLCLILNDHFVFFVYQLSRKNLSRIALSYIQWKLEIEQKQTGLFGHGLLCWQGAESLAFFSWKGNFEWIEDAVT